MPGTPLPQDDKGKELCRSAPPLKPTSGLSGQPVSDLRHEWNSCPSRPPSSPAVSAHPTQDDIAYELLTESAAARYTRAAGQPRRLSRHGLGWLELPPGGVMTP